MTLARMKSAAVLLLLIVVAPFATQAGPPEKKPALTIDGGASCLAFSPDGKTLACGLVLRDLATGKVSAKGELEEKFPPCTHVAFSPDGNRLASVHYDRGYTQARHAVCLWHVARRGEMGLASTLFLQKDTHADYERSLHYLAFSPDGRMLVTRSLDNGAVVWETASGKERRRLDVQGLAVAFGADGRTLISVSRDGLVRHWNLFTGKCADPADASGRDGFLFVLNAVSSADGKTLALTDGYTVLLKDARTGKTLRRFGDLYPVGLMALSADGKKLGIETSDGSRVFDTSTGKELGHLKGARSWDGSLAFSPDGKSFAAAWDKSVTVWEMAHLVTGEKGKGQRAAVPLEATVTSRKAAYTLDLGGKTPEEFARTVRASTLPPSPKIDLVVTLRNTSDKNMIVDPDGHFDAYLVGDGAMNHPDLPRQTGVVRGEGIIEPEKIVLAPGGSYSLPLTTLSYDYGRQSYWLQPGEYTLYVSYCTGVNPAPEGWTKLEDGSGIGTLRAAPIRLKVVAEKK